MWIGKYIAERESPLEQCGEKQQFGGEKDSNGCYAPSCVCLLHWYKPRAEPQCAEMEGQWGKIYPKLQHSHALLLVRLSLSHSLWLLETLGLADIGILKHHNMFFHIDRSRFLFLSNFLLILMLSPATAKKKNRTIVEWCHDLSCEERPQFHTDVFSLNVGDWRP